MSQTVLLTATVYPQVTSRLTIREFEDRRAQYRSAVEFWVEAARETDASVVIVENSGASIDDFVEPRSAHRDRVGLLSAPAPSASAIARGKGAAEAEMLDWAIDELNPPPNDLVFKCTGRLFVRNFHALAAGLRPGADLVLDLPRRRPVIWCDSRFFGATGATWRDSLRGFALEVDDEIDRVYEHVLADRAVARSAAAAGTVHNFCETPWIVGRSGTSGRTYSSSRLRAAVRPAYALVDRARRRYAARL